jgi:hypothetical protein
MRHLSDKWVGRHYDGISLKLSWKSRAVRFLDPPQMINPSDLDHWRRLWRLIHSDPWWSNAGHRGYPHGSAQELVSMSSILESKLWKAGPEGVPFMKAFEWFRMPRYSMIHQHVAIFCPHLSLVGSCRVALAVFIPRPELLGFTSWNVAWLKLARFHWLWGNSLRPEGNFFKWREDLVEIHWSEFDFLGLHFIPIHKCKPKKFWGDMGIQCKPFYPFPSQADRALEPPWHILPIHLCRSWLTCPAVPDAW